MITGRLLAKRAVLIAQQASSCAVENLYSDYEDHIPEENVRIFINNIRHTLNLIERDLAPLNPK